MALLTSVTEGAPRLGPSPRRHNPTDDSTRVLPAAARRNRSVATKHTGVQAGEGADWGDRSISRVMRLMRLPNANIRKRTRCKPHVRMWHAPAARPEDLLTTALQTTIDEVKQVLATCLVCPPWVSVGKRPIATLKTAQIFHEELQMDSSSWRDACPTHRRSTSEDELRPVLHIVCVRVRFSQALILRDRMVANIPNAIVHLWFRTFGPPKRIVFDQESALNTDAGRAGATRWNTTLVLRARKAHARTIERHNELLRSHPHRVEGQRQREGLALSPETIPDECVLAETVMLCVHGVPLCTAVFGRVPNWLSEFEPLFDTALDDENDGIQGVSRNVNRL